jgi:hypothetical protein
MVTAMVAPRVIITNEAFRAMRKEVLAHPDIETSWQQAGFVIAGRDVVITNVILAGVSDIVRTGGNTVIGGEFQRACFQWLMDEHVKMFRRKPAIYTDKVTYGYVFSGHSHHRLQIYHYSGVDLDSIYKAVAEDKIPVAVGPLANIRRMGFFQSTPLVANEPVVNSRNEASVDWRFYYLSADMVKMGIHSPFLVQPTFIDQAKLPYEVPVLAWRFVDAPRFDRQISQLTHYGCKINVVNQNIPEEEHMVVQFVITKPGWKSPLMVTTKWDFPTSRPVFTVYADGKKTTLPEKLENSDSPIWIAGMDIIESVIRLVEAEVL